MAYTTIDDPTAHFQVKKYTGNGNSNHAITFDGNSNMQPDLLWNKVSSEADSHAMFDSSRGNTKILYPNVTLVEGTDGNGNIESFDSNGFTVGGNQQYANHDGATQMTWAWKANGGTTSSNSNGDITSTVQANTTAGFSIVLYTGNGNDGDTVGHGLSGNWDFVIIKNRGQTDYWTLSTTGTNQHFMLHDNSQQANHSTAYPSKASGVIGLNNAGDLGMLNGNGETYVAYVFKSIKGYSRFGNYKGNGDANGPFIYLGFRPAFFLLKRISGSGNLLIYDNKRDTFNEALTYLVANATDASSTATDGIDFLSNGVKIKRTGNSWNESNGDYFYWAMAEHPFVTSKGTPAQAR